MRYVDTPQPAAPRRVLLLVLDGLRPGSVTHDAMPNLAALADRGVTYTRSRTGFPSQTMVGAGELLTGAYPERSGITSNWMPVPGSPIGGVELKSLAGIQRMADGFGGRALTATSVHEVITQAGGSSAVIGKEGPAELAFLGGAEFAVSTGGANVSARGRVLERERGTAPLAKLVADGAGPAPARGPVTDIARSTWLVRAAGAVDAAHAPDLLTVWLTDPDSTQHQHGLTNEQARAGLRDADRAVGMLLADLTARGTLDQFDIIVTSDHGFSEHTGPPLIPIEQTLRDAGLDIAHVIATGNQHQVRFAHPPTAADFARLRAAVGSAPFAGLVRTVIDNPREGVAGDRRDDATLTGADLRQGVDRAADAYIIYERDEHDPRGPASVPADSHGTTANHGSLGWSDINNTLIVAGPSFERAPGGAAALRTDAPAGIFDVAPTIAHLLGAQRADTMQGRVLLEALAGSAGPIGRVGDVHATRSTATHEAQLGSRIVRTQLVTEQVGGASYFESLLSSTV